MRIQGRCKDCDGTYDLEVEPIQINEAYAWTIVIRWIAIVAVIALLSGVAGCWIANHYNELTVLMSDPATEVTYTDPANEWPSIKAVRPGKPEGPR